MLEAPSKKRLPTKAKPDKKTTTVILSGICFLFALIGLTTPNPLETFFGCLIWPVFFTLLWSPGEQPALMFAATFQSFQVFTPVLVANTAGQTLQQNLGLSFDVSIAFYLGILAVLALAWGMKLGIANLAKHQTMQMNESGLNLSVYRLGIAYVVTFIFSSLFASFAFADAGLTQLLLAIASFRWFVVFLITWTGLRYSKFRLLFIAVIFLEVVVGITGFFSGFKTILFMVLVVYGGTSNRVSRLLRPQFLIMIFVTLLLTIYWQSVKSDYRSYVNLGTLTQTVQVSIWDRLAFHGQAIENLNSENIKGGFESGLERLGYIKFLAGSINTVPSVVPYQNGNLWFEAFANLVPRFLFPNKPVIDDSVRTNAYSGIAASGADKGTSISIGYVGESYIDFGIPFMFLPIFALGYFWGWGYNFLVRAGTQPLLGTAAATTLLLNVSIFFESSNLKVVAGAVSSGLVYLVFLHFASNSVWKWLTVNSQVSN